jgi:hypothetical protein
MTAEVSHRRLGAPNVALRGISLPSAGWLSQRARAGECLDRTGAIVGEGLGAAVTD